MRFGAMNTMSSVFQSRSSVEHPVLVHGSGGLRAADVPRGADGGAGGQRRPRHRGHRLLGGGRVQEARRGGTGVGQRTEGGIIFTIPNIL